MIFWSEDKEVKQCKHCGVNFTVDESIGWKQSREQFTCDDCYQSGKRDWASDFDDENTF